LVFPNSLEADVDARVEEEAGGRGEERSPAHGSNIVLLGGMGSGKSTVGWLLARLVGYGFIDFDHVIETRQKKKVTQIFDEVGEPEFRRMERELVMSLSGIRSHVLSLGGGTVMDDDSWDLLQRLGVTVWLNPPPEEIARRMSQDEAELAKRPLLAELATHKDKETRHKLLTERIKALSGNRSERYRQAHVVVSDSFSTPDSTAHLVKDTLVRDGALTFPKDQRPYDRWGIL
jgi:shikimate kinase